MVLSGREDAQTWRGSLQDSGPEKDCAWGKLMIEGTSASDPVNPWRIRVLLAVSILFVGYKAYEALGPLLPAPYARSFPWGVFTIAQPYSIDYVVWGETADGKVVSIDLHRWFSYTRGFARLYVYQEHGGLAQDGKPLRAFARWLAHRVWSEDGTKLRVVHVEQHRTYASDHRKRVKPIASVEIEDDAFEGSTRGDASVKTP